jgi:hypothetical protein
LTLRYEEKSPLINDDAKKTVIKRRKTTYRKEGKHKKIPKIERKKGNREREGAKIYCMILYLLHKGYEYCTIQGMLHKERAIELNTRRKACMCHQKNLSAFSFSFPTICHVFQFRSALSM